MDHIVAGIDVGSARKGFHGVALVANQVLGVFQSADAREIAGWCAEMGAAAVGVDAPCRWSNTGRARPAERELMQAGIWCFSSPDRERAVQHPKNQFGWMLAGEALYLAMAPRYRLFSGKVEGRRIVFETFPHAVTCSLSGKVVPAKNKSTVRRALLAKQGIADKSLRNIDFVDAALCALTARHLLAGKWRAYGDRDTGHIVIPSND
jgi:predicted nuclease with RNAse H fold